MKISEFIETAKEGGWQPQNVYTSYVYDIGGGRPIQNVDFYNEFLDPKAWEAVGKKQGWDDFVVIKMEDLDLVCDGLPFLNGTINYSYNEGGAVTLKIKKWKWLMHGLVTHVISGGTVESYLSDITQKNK